MVLATSPLLSSSTPSLPLASTSTRQLRRSQPVCATMRRCSAHVDNNILRFPHSARCCNSVWFSDDTAAIWKRISVQKLCFDSQQRLIKSPVARTRTWKPCRVKSEEMEESSGRRDTGVDEQTLQRDLRRAIEDENYSLAAKLRDDIRLLQDDSKAAVLAANNRFYEAFKKGDFVAMRSIWMEDDKVCCIHPGAGAISGHDLVMGSWEIVCGATHEFPIMIDLRNVEVYVRGEVGYVTCMEVVKTKGSSWGRQVATNVFAKVDGKWLMCIHHASHVDM